MASQQGQKTQGAFLQAVVRVERIGELPVVCVEHAAAEILGAARLAPQANELVEHLPLSSIERTQQGLVEPPQGPAQPSEKPAINHLGLGEIGDLGGAAQVGGGGE